jgi:chromosome segregation ATPase
LATPDPLVTALVAFEARLIDRLDTRFEQLTTTLKLEFAGVLDAITRKLDHLEVEYAMLKAGMARIEGDVAVLKAAYGDLTAAFEDQRAALTRLEADVAQVKASVVRLEADLVRVASSVERLEAGQAEDRAERLRMRGEIDALKERVGDLDARVKALEARLPGR